MTRLAPPIATEIDTKPIVIITRRKDIRYKSKAALENRDLNKFCAVVRAID
jgi:hypothetical protein